MDRIAFVIAEDPLATGVRQRAEPVINGVSLVEIVEAAEGCEPHYAGVQADALQIALRGPQDWIYRKVLSCVCERPGCSWVIAQVKYEDDTVT